MVQALRDLGIEFVAANPGSSFEALHESIVNYGERPNVNPEFISAMHEASAVDMAHGYAKATGHPMAVALHATVGIQNASMAIYQAFLDRTPMILLVGRDEGFIPAHGADDMAALVRAYTKWDAQPTTLAEALTAIQRAYSEAITPPCAPTMVVLDAALQKQAAGGLTQPQWQPPSMPSITAEDARAIAERLLAAENPRLEVGRLRTPAGCAAAVTLAELTGASVGTRANSGPMSFPQSHRLAGPGAGGSPDFVLGLEVPTPGVAIVSPGVGALQSRDAAGIGFSVVRGRGGRAGANVAGANSSQAGQPIVADAEASLDLIVAAVRAGLTPARRRGIAQRAARHAPVNRADRVAKVRAALEFRRKGWDDSPVSTARLYAEIWPHIADQDWCIGAQTTFSGSHHSELWPHDRHYSYLGAGGASGVGGNIGMATGAALAARGRGRLVIDIQNDGDLNFTPGALWTAAHHRLPLLIVMHNNRAWHQERMFIQYMSGVRGRGTNRAHVGTELTDPPIDYALLARGYGVEAEGPISDPAGLSSAYARGVAAVKDGRPYLIDVLTQPR
jgi:thiamine pyrophosphate-dependent acetolactate synthase large subunit-like protein